MFPNTLNPNVPIRPILPPIKAPISKWDVALFRKAEVLPRTNQLDQHHQPLQYGSFYIQLQPPQNGENEVLYFRYQKQQEKNSAHIYTLPFTVSLLKDIRLSAETSALSTTKFYSADQQSLHTNDSESLPTLLLKAKAFLGVLVLNSSANSITANTAGTIRPFMIFATDSVFLGQLYDAYIYRITQVATISIRDNPDDENYVTGIKKLFQARCFYYSTFCDSKPNNDKMYFNKPYDITLCTQRMIQEHDSDLRFYWNRGLCLPLLKFGVDVRYWIPKVMCGGIETYRNPSDDVELWLISRLSCERAGTRFNVRGVNDDGAVANFVETEQIVVIPKHKHYSSFVIIRGSIPIFWYQPKFQVGTHRITISRSEALSYKAFFEHFKSLYHHYGRITILNLVETGNHEAKIGEEYKKLFTLFVKNQQLKMQQQKDKPQSSIKEKDFIWFEYHKQSTTVRNLTPEQFVDHLLIQNSQYPCNQLIERYSCFTYMDKAVQCSQQGVFRVNCIDCLDRTNNVQLTIGIAVLQIQLATLKRKHINNTVEHLKGLWVLNGDHISRIYTGTGALLQRSKAKDIQRSVGRAIQNNLRDDEKQQSIQTLIYSYAKDSYLHERSVAALLTPYVVSDGLVLSEMFNIRKSYIKKETFRVSLGTWNINGDKNPALQQGYPQILDSWILDGPDNVKNDRRNLNQGIVSNEYTKAMPDILAIGFQEICDLSATNMVWQSSENASRWVKQVQYHFKTKYPNDEYILLGNDQLVGVCLAVFIRRDLAQYVKNIAIDSVKTGLGGKMGNKGAVAIRLVLHSTSICFVCAHFSAGQNEDAERNKDYKSIMEKLSFQAPSRALWHDHIFFFGDFNYRLTIPRAQVEKLLSDNMYDQLITYDQLRREHTEGRVFHEFKEGQILFPPTYKYDIGNDYYDTSEKARTPSYTDRILWRSMPHVCSTQLFYGRSEVKTSDHRPVSGIFAIEVEVCDEVKLYHEYIKIYERFAPTNGLILFDMIMRSDIIDRKANMLDEFVLYIKKNYDLDSFSWNKSLLTLNMFFEHGDYARRVSKPEEDQLPNGTTFRKRIPDEDKQFAIMQKLNLLFSNVNETMYPESALQHDIGPYQQPSKESLSTEQEVTVAGVVSENIEMPEYENNGEPVKVKSDEEIANHLDIVHDLARTIEHKRRKHGEQIADVKIRKDKEIVANSSSDNDKYTTPSSDDSDIDSHSSTSSPYGSSSESSSSYDEHLAELHISKKKIHKHHKGPFREYLEETVKQWQPKHYLKQYKRSRMKKHDGQITYGNVHTKQIKRSLKHEKHLRQKIIEENKNEDLAELVRDMTYGSVQKKNENHNQSDSDDENEVEKNEKQEQTGQSPKLHSQTSMVKMAKKLAKPFKHHHHHHHLADTSSSVDGEVRQQQQQYETKLRSLEPESHDLITIAPSLPTSAQPLFQQNVFDPFHFNVKNNEERRPTQTTLKKSSDTTNGNLLLFDPPDSTSKFYINLSDLDPVKKIEPLQQSVKTSQSSLSSTSSTQSKISNSSSPMPFQHPQHIPIFPTRPPPKIPTLPTLVKTPQSLPLKSINIQNTNEEHDNNVHDLGDPGTPPPNPPLEMIFDPFAFNLVPFFFYTLIMKYDDFLNTIGSFGKYQKWKYFIICLSYTLPPIMVYTWSFAAASPAFQCQTPNDTLTDYYKPDVAYCEENKKSISIKECQRCNIKISKNSILEVHPCENYIFDKQYYQNTLVEEWKMVCDRVIYRSIVQNVFFVGYMVGSIFFGMLADKYGRRPIMSVSFILMTFSGFLCAFFPQQRFGFWPSYIVYIIGRFLLACATRGISVSGFVLGSELVGPDKKLFTGIVIEYFFAFGQFILVFFAYFIRTWRTLSFTLSLFTVPFLFFYFILPESPRWMVSKGKFDEAEKSLRSIAATNQRKFDDEAFEQLKLEQKKIMHNKTQEVFYGVSQNTGSWPFNPYLNFAASAFVELISYVVVHLILDRIGRKIPYCGSVILFSIVALSAIPINIYMIKDSNAQKIMIFIVNVVLKFLASFSYAIIYIYANELFPTGVRNTGMGICSMVARVGAIIGTTCNDLLTRVWTELPIVLYGCVSLIAAILALMFPETLNKPLPQSVEDVERMGLACIRVKGVRYAQNESAIVEIEDENEDRLLQEQLKPNSNGNEL
ncbi:unnamed protein product [Didymodactylos carnosus]|uniref:phosphoinositide 5-phosphatase n=1 Tax=Didymodactylos carnosus TaxID=1234261 RepID=A0A813P6U3_9BILA|nr:unnamed protein product [Didymodactylos carnosus]CAF3528293.1 unnamed protein product [Didymodactylos carnosus]